MPYRAADHRRPAAGSNAVYPSHIVGSPFAVDKTADKAAERVDAELGTLAYRPPPATAATGRPVILVLSGALSPVHRSHVQLLHAAKAGLECASRGADRRHVIAAVLAPSSHSYVKGKLGDGAIPLHGRVELCRRAVKDDGAPWLGVAPWGIASGAHTCEVLQQQLAHEHARFIERGGVADAVVTPSVLSVHGSAVDVLAVYGSDFLVRCPGCLRKPTLIYGREDADNTAKEGRRLVARQASEGTLHPQFLFVEPAPSASEEVTAVPELSSTAIRGLLVQARGGGGGGVSAEEADAADADDDESQQPSTTSAVVAASAITKLAQALHPGVLAECLRTR
jgi:hypothetical protein